jgi:hypothetical protein
MIDWRSTGKRLGMFLSTSVSTLMSSREFSEHWHLYLALAVVPSVYLTYGWLTASSIMIILISKSWNYCLGAIYHEPHGVYDSCTVIKCGLVHRSSDIRFPATAYDCTTKISN